MSGLFVTVLNMSLTAGCAVLVVMLARLPLKKAPKIFSYALWAVVLFRLICPFSFESVFSLSLWRSDAIPRDIAYSQSPAINSGIAVVDGTVNQTIQSALPAAESAASSASLIGVNYMELLINIGAWVWLLGIAVILCYAAVSYIRLKRRVSTATLVRGNIFETDLIETPFVMGFFRPKIYLPLGLAESEAGYIIAHEEIHIRHRDYIIKPLAFLALSIHWFNPLIWAAYFLMAKDMELSCDESVMKRSDEDIRAQYSGSLLSLSVKQSGLLAPLAFGESNVKARVKNVLNYKKPAFWVTLVAVVAVIAVIVGLAANRKAAFDIDEVLDDTRYFTTEETDLLKIGEAAFDHYFSTFAGETVPEEYRITEYKLNDITLEAGDESEFCVLIHMDYTAAGLYFGVGGRINNNGTYSHIDESREFRVKSLGGNQYEIVSVGTGGGTQGLEPVREGIYPYTNAELGFSIPFPSDWEDKLIIKDYYNSDDGVGVVYFMHRATYETLDAEYNFGTLFLIYIYDSEEKWDMYNHTEVTGERLIAEYGGTYYSLEYPTDVQLDISDETLMSGYMEMADVATYDWIKARIAVFERAGGQSDAKNIVTGLLMGIFDGESTLSIQFKTTNVPYPYVTLSGEEYLAAVLDMFGTYEWSLSGTAELEGVDLDSYIMLYSENSEKTLTIFESSGLVRYTEGGSASYYTASGGVGSLAERLEELCQGQFYDETGWVNYDFEDSTNSGDIGFCIEYPSGWSLVEQKYWPADDTREASPDTGIQFIFSGGETFSVFAMLNSELNIQGDFIAEEFTTPEGLHAMVYTETHDDRVSIYYIFEGDLPPYYCAAVNMSTEVYKMYKDDIVRVMQSFKLTGADQ